LGVFRDITFPEPNDSSGGEITYDSPTGLLPLERRLLEWFEQDGHKRIKLDWTSLRVSRRAHTGIGHYTDFFSAQNSKQNIPYSFLNGFKLKQSSRVFQWILRLDNSCGVNLEIFKAKETDFPNDGIISEIETFNPDPASVD
jgi:hypothetical protein